jgi:MFS family permease
MHRNVRLLQYFAFFYCFRPHWPIAVLYFQEVTGSFASAMTIHSVVFLSQTFLEVPTGLFSDGSRRRSAMIAGGFFSALSITLYASGATFMVLLIGALAEGISRALFSGTEQALLFESVPKENRESLFQHAQGRVNAMAQLGLCTSAALCALLTMVSFKAVLWTSVLPQIVVLLVVLGLQDVASSQNHRQSFLQVFRGSLAEFHASAKLRLIALAQIFEFGCMEALFYFQSAFLATLVPAWMLGVARCLNHFAGFVGFWFAGGVLRVLGARQTLIFGTSLGAFVKVVATSIASPLSPLLLAVSNCIYGPCDTARATILQSEFTDTQRATMGSMVSLGGSLLFGFVSTLLGVVADAYGPQAAMFLGIGGYLAIIPLYARLFEVSRRTALKSSV